MNLEILGILLLLLSMIAFLLFVINTLFRLSSLEDSIKDIYREQEFEKRLASYIESQEIDND